MKRTVTQKEPCFACGKMLHPGRPAYEARIVGEDGIVWVGADCYRRITRAGIYQPPQGGPRLTV